MTKELEEKYPTLKVGLAMSKAEGNLKFLAECEMASVTQGNAVLDALHAVQKARKAYAEILEELSDWRSGVKRNA